MGVPLRALETQVSRGAACPRLLVCDLRPLFNRRPYEQGAPILKNVRDTSGSDALTPLVVSVTTTSVYEAQARTNVWPPGQTSVDAGGPAVALPEAWPFFAWTSVPPLTSALAVSLFAAFG